MKQKFRIFLCVCLSLVLLPLSVSAYSESRSPAAGYDPSTTQIDFNIPLDPDGPFYVTVFTSEPQGNLKLHTSGGKTGDASPGRDAYRKLSEYRDSDGLTFCGEVCDCTGQLSLIMENPPDIFKIVCYLPRHDLVLPFRKVHLTVPSQMDASIYGIHPDPEEYDSRYVMAEIAVKPDPVPIGTIPRSYSFPIIYLLPPAYVLQALLIKLGMAFLVGLRKRSVLKCIFRISIITQSVLALLLFCIARNTDPLSFLFFHLLPAFLAVVIAEGLLYKKYFARLNVPETADKAWGYAVMSNLITNLVGMLLIMYWPVSVFTRLSFQLAP